MRRKTWKVAIALLVALGFLGALPAASAQPQSPGRYSAAQLDQMLAPIALYPDALVGQILMASTYPLEVVEAARWVQEPANAALKGAALASALETLDWDPSVKALVPFPSVLLMMNSRLDWMQQLGDAFLAQEADVMDSVQRLRREALRAGTLASTPQQTVTTDDGVIVIVPATPGILYVPAYDPGVVYGPWPYPDYPPFFFVPPPGYYYGPLVAGIVFGIGFVIVDSFWGWDHCDWHRHRIDVDAHRINVINRHYIEHHHRPRFEGRVWEHNPLHRVGVPYRSPQVRERFERHQPGSARERYEFRGHESPPAVKSPAPPPARRTAPRVVERTAPTVVERPAAPIYQRSRSGAEAREYSVRGRESRSTMPSRGYAPRDGGGTRSGESRRR